ncbi:reverse transcriptase domain-containing protein [Artemisia annua]|uniref:Reverse transcriptase domain-containing protein n=1 Tax=Artemisia annua TaxID=35608 RepID=A0A2U1MR32_ARTAN|nr:reverse transcriptase domain-containing protein [Artemisia annua]
MSQYPNDPFFNTLFNMSQSDSSSSSSPSTPSSAHPISSQGYFLRTDTHNIGRPERGVKLLGGAVSRDAGFISDLSAKRAARAVDLMGLLPRLRDPQSELLLLRSCMGVAKLLFGLRTCQPPFVENAVSCFDKGLREAIEDIVVCGGGFFGDLQWRVATLPLRLGGLGLSSARDVATYAFVASRSETKKKLGHARDFPPSMTFA